MTFTAFPQSFSINGKSVGIGEGKTGKNPDSVVVVCESDCVSVCVGEGVGVGVGGIGCNAKYAYGLDRVEKGSAIIFLIFLKSIADCPISKLHGLLVVFLCPADIGGISALRANIGVS